MNNINLITGSQLFALNIPIKHPTVKEVLDFGRDKYSGLIGLFCFKNSDFSVELDDAGRDYTKEKTYDIFISLCLTQEETAEDGMYTNIRKEVYDSLVWMTGIEGWVILRDNEKNENFICAYQNDNEYIINEHVFYMIRNILCEMNFIDSKEDEVPGNEYTRKIFIDQKRKQIEKQKKHPKERYDNFSDIISCVVWGGNMSFDDVLNLKIYQLYDGYVRIDRIMTYKAAIISEYSKYELNNETIEKLDYKKKYNTQSKKLETIGEIKNRTGM